LRNCGEGGPRGRSLSRRKEGDAEKDSDAVFNNGEISAGANNLQSERRKVAWPPRERVVEYAAKR